MHTGVISFCDRVFFNVKCSQFKGNLLNKLEGAYGLKIITRHWHHLGGEKGMQIVQTAPHWMCLRSNGNPYFLVLTTIDDVPTIVFVDKKVQPGYEYPRMILGRGRFDPAAFVGSGTVLDGEMVRDTRGGWAFLINDVIAYAGQALGRMKLAERLAKGGELLAGHVPDPYMDGCVYHLKRFVAPTQEGLTCLLEMAATLPYTHRGVYFWPDNAKYKPKLHNFDDSLIKPVIRKVKDAPDFRESVTAVEAPAPIAAVAAPPAVLAPVPVAPAPAAAAAGGATVTMWLKKTENPDVYDVYPPYDTGSNIRLGIAGVPSLQVSKMLRSVFRTLTVAQPMSFECVWHSEFQKYVPMRLATV